MFKRALTLMMIVAAVGAAGLLSPGPVDATGHSATRSFSAGQCGHGRHCGGDDHRRRLRPVRRSDGDAARRLRLRLHHAGERAGDRRPGRDLRPVRRGFVYLHRPRPRHAGHAHLPRRREGQRAGQQRGRRRLGRDGHALRRGGLPVVLRVDGRRGRRVDGDDHRRRVRPVRPGGGDAAGRVRLRVDQPGRPPVGQWPDARVLAVRRGELHLYGDGVQDAGLS